MRNDLLAVIRSARRRWRLRVLLHGASLVAAVGLIAAVAGAWGADHFRFSPAALIAFRVFVWGTVLVVLARFLVRPLWRRITDQQVALYLEEHEPSLDGAVLTALTPEGVETGHSRALIERVIGRAIEQLSAVGGGRRIERPSLRRSSAILAGVAAVAVLVLLLGPRSIRAGLPFMVGPLGTAGSPYAIDVTPGDSTAARGADLRIGATLRGFTAEDVTLVMRAEGAPEWERVDLAPDEERGDYGTLLFDLQDTTEYFVTGGGVRSAVHRIAVVDLPYVQRIALEYRFPAYTGLDPVREEDGGDIAALVGTRVGIEVTPTISAPGGALLVGTDTVPLAAGDSGAALTAALTVVKSGSYRVLLAGPDGRLLPASPEYFIDALDDQPPMVRITQPGRDVSVTSVDEVFTEVQAEDDYGLRQVELVYAVNGGAESTAVLYDGRNRSKELTAGHTLYLEELSLQPGDVIAYYARARDARRDDAPAATDIYFVTIRPFDRQWRVSEAQGGQQGQQGASPGELSQRQREIVAATFRLVRDSAQYEDGQWRDNLATVTLMQGRLREEVETLVSRLRSRGVVEMDSTFATVAEALPQAVTAMQEAEEQLGRRRADSALPPEQRALQQLQRAEAAFRDRQVTRGQQGGGGGNAAGDTDAEQLAELFELDLDRLRNQYESVERGQRQQSQQQADEALEKLRELARRQQQENERRRARAMRDPNGGGGAGQRRLAQEAEELGRRLERLSRERSNPELGEAARRLQDAAEAMRRAASAGASGGGTAQGEAAVEQLRDARRRLEGSRQADLQRDIQDAVRRADRLVEQQGEIQRRLRDLPAEGAGRQQQVQPLSERKQQMADEVDRLESEMDRLARDARGEQPEAADRLRAAVQAARDRRLQDKIRYSRGVIAQRSPEYAERFEEGIAGDLQAMRDSLAGAAGAITESGEQRMQRALERTRDLTRALASLEERARERADRDSGVGARAGRQLRGELRRRLGDLRDTRDQLNRAGADVGPLNDIIRRLGRLDATGQIDTPRGLDELSQAIVQGLKDYEFALRRAVLGDETPRAALATDDDVPPQYRALVEEYYRRLARQRR